MLLLPSLPGGASEDPLDMPPTIPWRRRGLRWGGGGEELLLAVCYQIVPKLLKWRGYQLQQQRPKQ